MILEVDPQAQRLAARVRRWPCFAGIDADKIGERLLGAVMAGVRIDWIEAAIDRVAEDADGADAAGEPMSNRAKAQTLIRYGMRPLRPRPPQDDGDQSEADHGQRKRTEAASYKAAEKRRQRAAYEAGAVGATDAARPVDEVLAAILGGKGNG